MKHSTVNMQQPFPWALIAGTILLTVAFVLAETKPGQRLGRAVPLLSRLMRWLHLA